MNIGICGVGVVGSAISFGMTKLGHNTIHHDIKLNTSIQNLFKCDIIFICVPTPQNNDGSCDTKIVEAVIKDLCSPHCQAILVIKSTISPGTTRRLSELYPDASIAFCPEFLRERSPISDFVENHNILVVGTYLKDIYDRLVECHGSYPKKTVMMTPTQAELLKYMHNCINAMRVSFANKFYDICQELKEEYRPIKESLLHSNQLPDKYLDVAPNFRGFGGVCLQKDLNALIHFCKSINIDSKLFKEIKNVNDKLEITVFEGMRK